MAIPKQFNKIDAFDELTALLNTGANPKMSDTISAMMKAQDYMQKVHDEAFQEGFEAGLDAQEININNNGNKD